MRRVLSRLKWDRVDLDVLNICPAFEGEWIKLCKIELRSLLVVVPVISE